jgi:hypothetical protein
MVFNRQISLGAITYRIVLVLSPAMRGGARNRNRTIKRNAARSIDYEHEHEHEQPKIHVTMSYFMELRLEHIYSGKTVRPSFVGAEALLPFSSKRASGCFGIFGCWLAPSKGT